MTQIDMLFGERRKHARIGCLRMIGVNDYSKLYTGHLRDVAKGGAFIEPRWKNTSKVGEELLLSIPYGTKNGYVNVPAKVEWSKTNGIGVRFISAKTSL